MKLYIYEHCPFSTRCVFIAKYLRIPVEIMCLQYYDQETTTKICGVPTIPLLVLPDRTYAAGYHEIIAALIDSCEIGQSNIISRVIERWQEKALPLYREIIYPCLFNLNFTEFEHGFSRDRFNAEHPLQIKEETNDDRQMRLGYEATEMMHAAKSIVLEHCNGEMDLPDQSVLYSILRAFYMLPEFEKDEYLHRWLKTACDYVNEPIRLA